MIGRINPKSKFKVVSVSDDSIDVEASPKIDTEAGEQLKYVKTLDINDLVLKEGSAPTFFWIRNLTDKEQVEAHSRHFKFNSETRRQEMIDSPLLFDHLFRICCTHIEEAGETLKIVTFDKFEKMPETEQSKYIAFEQLPYSVKQEIGAIVFTRSMTGESQKKD